MEIKYRPEIDGLRTVAVLSVIIYHAEFLISGHKFLQGGFFGVDVFFVISGFLITSLMMNEFHGTGSISISNFYWRRARRLLPALLVVMLASMPFAWIYLLPSQLVDYAQSLISSLLFSSNFYWDYSLQAYGAESSLLKPFLHTWSLAVEEQYYIVFPLILLAIYKWFKSHTITLLTAGLLLSLQYAQWMTPQDGSFSFYMLSSRFWELLAGALLANILHLHPQKENDALLNKTMPILGLVLILYSFVFIGFDSGHPGFITLIPVIGTMLIIWFASEEELVTKTLSSRSFVYIGLISYSLYLWHYPIFAFFRIDGLFDSNVGRLAAISLTFILSMVSVKFIEKPLRNKKDISNSKFLVLVVLLFVFIVSGSLLMIKKEGFEYRFKSKGGLLNYERDNQALRQKTWTLLIDALEKPFEQTKVKVLIVGNSHAKDIFNAFYQNPLLYKGFDFRTVSRMSQIGCFYEGNEVANKFFLSDKYIQSQIVVISTRYQVRKCQKGDVKKYHDIDGLPYLIRRALLDKKKVVVFGNTVEFKVDAKGNTIADSLIQGREQAGELEDLISNDDRFDLFKFEVNREYFELKNRKNNINQRVKAIAEKFGAPFFDKYHFICEEEDSICFGLTPDGYKSFYDYGHFTLEGSKFFGGRMAQSGVIELLEK